VIALFWIGHTTRFALPFPNMKIAVIADEDSFLDDVVPEHVDVLLSCGDLPDTTILKLADRMSVLSILAVKGNHDSSAPFTDRITDVHLDITIINGIRFARFQGSKLRSIPSAPSGP